MKDLRATHDRPSDWLTAFEACLAAATPGPWDLQACSEDASLFEVRAADSRVETDLPRAFARYICFLAAASAQLIDAARGRSHLTRSQRADLSKSAKDNMEAVRAEWVFVARSPQRDGYFLHDCVRRVGAGTLSRADALFIDEAKHAVPRLLTGNAPLFEATRLPQKGTRTVVVPRRETVKSDVAAEYGAFAEDESPLHALSGRNEVVERTIAMSDAIRSHMDFTADHRVLDIGCGDASLLRSLAPSIAKGVGTVLTAAERNKLAGEPALKDLNFVAVSFADLSAVRGPFDRVVANGCIHFVRNRMGAERALRGIAALMPAKAKLWIGELHARDCRRLVFSSKRAALRHVRKRHGNIFALVVLRHLWRRRRRAGVIVEPAALDWWHVLPQDFVLLAERCGFEVDGLWSCRDLTGDSFYALQDRYSCRLIKQ